MLPEEKLRLRVVFFFFLSHQLSHVMVQHRAEPRRLWSLSQSVVLYGDPFSQWGWNEVGRSQGSSPGSRGGDF